jgi:hypothetical protein
LVAGLTATVDFAFSGPQQMLSQPQLAPIVWAVLFSFPDPTIGGLAPDNQALVCFSYRE